METKKSQTQFVTLMLNLMKVEWNDKLEAIQKVELLENGFKVLGLLTQRAEV